VLRAVRIFLTVSTGDNTFKAYILKNSRWQALGIFALERFDIENEADA
jgi:hypothetical protein